MLKINNLGLVSHLFKSSVVFYELNSGINKIINSTSIVITSMINMLKWETYRIIIIIMIKQRKKKATEFQFN